MSNHPAGFKSFGEPQHSKVREEQTCIVCGGEKSKGLLICWPCHRRQKADHDGGYDPRLDDLFGRSAVAAHGIVYPTPSAPSVSRRRMVISSNALISPCVLSLSVKGSGIREKPASTFLIRAIGCES